MSRDPNRQQHIEIDIAGLATLIEFEVMYISEVEDAPGLVET